MFSYLLVFLFGVASGVLLVVGGILFLLDIQIKKNERVTHQKANTLELPAPPIILRNNAQISSKNSEDKESVAVAPVVDPIQFAILQKKSGNQSHKEKSNPSTPILLHPTQQISSTISLQSPNPQSKRSSASFEGESTIKVGWIKMRGTLKVWWSRWAILRPGKLIYYRTEKKEDCFGIVQLEGCHLTLRESRKHYSFRITHPDDKKIYSDKGLKGETLSSAKFPGSQTECVLRFDDQFEGQQWYAAVSKAILHSNNTSSFIDEPSPKSSLDSYPSTTAITTTTTTTTTTSTPAVVVSQPETDNNERETVDLSSLPPDFLEEEQTDDDDVSSSSFSTKTSVDLKPSLSYFSPSSPSPPASSTTTTTTTHSATRVLKDGFLEIVKDLNINTNPTTTATTTTNISGTNTNSSSSSASGNMKWCSLRTGQTLAIFDSLKATDCSILVDLHDCVVSLLATPNTLEITSRTQGRHIILYVGDSDHHHHHHGKDSTTTTTTTTTGGETGDEIFTKIRFQTNNLEEALVWKKVMEEEISRENVNYVPLILPRCSLNHIKIDEKCHWFNVFMERYFKDIQQSTELKQFCLRQITKKLDKISRPDFVGPVKLVDLQLGSQMIEIHQIRMLPFYHNTSTTTSTSTSTLAHEIVGEAQLTYSGGVSLSLTTEFYINFPKTHFATVPVQVFVRLDSAQGKILVYGQPSVFSRCSLAFVSQPVTNFSVNLKVGSKYDVSKISKISEFFTSALQKVLWKNAVYPNRITFSLPLPGHKLNVRTQTLTSKKRFRPPTTTTTTTTIPTTLPTLQPVDQLGPSPSNETVPEKH